MDTEAQAEDIRRQMHAFRTKLRSDVENVVENAKQLVDWRYYYRNFTWSTLGLAAGLGYVLVPRRPKTVPADAATIQELAHDKRLVVKSRPASWLTSLSYSLLPVLIRAGVDRFGRDLAHGFSSRSDENQPARETNR